MNSAFSFKLSHAVQAGLVCVGQFDGRHPSLAFATSTGNVLIHNPHRTDLAANAANASSSTASRANDVQQLAVNRKVTSLASGCFAGAASASSSASSSSASSASTSASSSRSGSTAGQQKDTLLVGTETNLMAYDVDRNSDLFFKVRSTMWEAAL